MATARPMPLLAPVTSATRSRSGLSAVVVDIEVDDVFDDPPATPILAEPGDVPAGPLEPSWCPATTHDVGEGREGRDLRMIAGEVQLGCRHGVESEGRLLPYPRADLIDPLEGCRARGAHRIGREQVEPFVETTAVEQGSV